MEKKVKLVPLFLGGCRAPGVNHISSPLPLSPQSLAARLRRRCSFSPRWLVNDVLKTRMKPVRGTL